MDFEDTLIRSSIDEDMEADSPSRVFRWEDASGLEHSCFYCSMKMNNPKARQHCFGVHSIPCIRYHQTMHAIGTSHKCFSCIQCDEIHASRHRKIAELLLEYKNYDQIGDTTIKRQSIFREIPGNVQPRRAERDAEVFGDDDEELRADDESFTIENPTTKLTPAERRAMKKEAKNRRSIHKANKNQQKHTISIRDEDLEHIRNVLHGNEDDEVSGTGHPLATDSTIEEVIARNLSFVNNIRDHQRYLLSSVAGRREYDKQQRERKRKGLFHDDHASKNEVVNAILIKLGVNIKEDSINNSSSKPENIKPTSTLKVTRSKYSNNPSTPANLKPRTTGKKAILERLREAILDDLKKDEHEKHETWVRAGGFWRYVGRPVFERMTLIAQRINWRTGVLNSA